MQPKEGAQHGLTSLFLGLLPHKVQASFPKVEESSPQVLLFPQSELMGLQLFIVLPESTLKLVSLLGTSQGPLRATFIILLDSHPLALIAPVSRRDHASPMLFPSFVNEPTERALSVWGHTPTFHLLYSCIFRN